VALVGDGDGRVQELLRDVLGDLELELTSGGAPDLVLAVVGKSELTAVVAEARRLAGSAPVLAIVPIGDARRLRASITSGADAAHALDAPLARLTGEVLALLERRRTESSPAGAPRATTGHGRNE
jgi:hypothetical protein